jgi:hypothetical protein
MRSCEPGAPSVAELIASYPRQSPLLPSHRSTAFPLGHERSESVDRRLSVRPFAELSDRVRSDDGGGSQVPKEVPSLADAQA